MGSRTLLAVNTCVSKYPHMPRTGSSAAGWHDPGRASWSTGSRERSRRRTETDGKPVTQSNLSLRAPAQVAAVTCGTSSRRPCRWCRTEQVILSGRAARACSLGCRFGSCGHGGDRRWYDGFIGGGERSWRTVVSKDELKRWLTDCYSVEFIDKSDPESGLSSYLVRGRPGNRSTVAVGGDARPSARSTPCSTCWPGSGS